MIFIFPIASIESLHANIAKLQTLFITFKSMKIVVIREPLIVRFVKRAIWLLKNKNSLEIMIVKITF